MLEFQFSSISPRSFLFFICINIIHTLPWPLIIIIAGTLLYPGCTIAGLHLKDSCLFAFKRICWHKRNSIKCPFLSCDLFQCPSLLICKDFPNFQNHFRVIFCLIKGQKQKSPKNKHQSQTTKQNPYKLGCLHML